MSPLFINHLKSQRELVQQLIGQGKHIVYCYLRHKDSGTAPQGTPYYFGIASNASRPFQPHKWTDQSGRKRHIPLPPDEAYIRIVAALPTRTAACNREQYCIARYGRKRFNTGILLNTGLGGESGSYGNRIPSRRIQEWPKVKQAALDAGVTPNEWMQIPSHLKAAWRSHLKRNPTIRISLRDYLNNHYESYEESRQRVGWQEVGASEEEWLELSKRQRKTALERFDKGRHWNEDAKSNPAPDVVERRIKNSVATRIKKCAKNLGMTEEKYQSISKDKRYQIKIWLEEHPDKTWQDYPVYGQHIPKVVANKRMIAGASKYGVDLKRYSSLSDSGRRSLRKRHANGRRDEALFQSLN